MNNTIQTNDANPLWKDHQGVFESFDKIFSNTRTEGRDDTYLAAKEFHGQCLQYYERKDSLINFLNEINSGTIIFHEHVKNKEDYRRVFIGFAKDLLDKIHAGVPPYA